MLAHSAQHIHQVNPRSAGCGRCGTGSRTRSGTQNNSAEYCLTVYSHLPQSQDQRPELHKVRDRVAREVRRLQAAHAAGAGPAVDVDIIRGLIRKVGSTLQLP